jgi:fido (protein-threonine AMPylation protein)
MKYVLKQVTREITEINKKFSSGVVINKGSLDFALSAVFRSKDWQEQLAFVVRALLCDHIFEDGNKRTAAAYLIAVLEHLKYRFDPFKIDQLVLNIAKNNITDIKKIRRMIGNASARNI